MNDLIVIYQDIEPYFAKLGEDNGLWIKHAVFVLFALNFSQLILWMIKKNGMRSRTPLKYLIPESLFTSLGILGTFVGIVLALKANPKTDTESVGKLMAGMSTAFITSIYGLVASLILGTVRHWVNKISSKIEKKDEIYYLKKMSENSSQDMAESAKLLADGVKDLMNAMKIMSESVDPDKTAEKIATAVTSSMNPFFKSLETKMSVIDNLAGATVELKDVNKQLAVFIQKDLRSIFDALRISVESSNQSIKETNESLQLTKISLEQQRDNLLGVELTLKNFSHDMREVLEKQLQDYKAVSTTSIDLLQLTGKNANELITNSAEQLRSSWKSVDENIEKAAKTTMRELEKFRDEYSKGLQFFLESQGDHLDKHLKANAEKLSETVHAMEGVLGNFVIRNENILENQNKSISLLSDIVAKTETTKVFHSSILTDANKKLVIANEHIEKNVNRLTENYSSTTASLEKISQTTKRIDEDFEKTVIKNIEEYQKRVDDHLANILNNIWNVTSIIASQAEANQVKTKERV